MSSNGSNGAAEYSAADIEALGDLEAVRKRPGMYIGGTGTAGLSHLLWEIIDNAVDEASAGFASRVTVEDHGDGSWSVTDDGRGIPVDVHSEQGVSALEVVFTQLHTGGKFGGGSYSASGGLHGVGAAVVNALSNKVTVTVWRDEKRHKLDFLEGKPGHFTGTEQVFVETSELDVSPNTNPDRTGTRVRFHPNRRLFAPDARISLDSVQERLRTASYLVPGVLCRLRHADGTGTDFRNSAGLTDLVDAMIAEGDHPMDDYEAGKPILATIPVTAEDTFVETVPSVTGELTDIERTVQVTGAIGFTSGYGHRIASFVNTVPTPDGGTHLTGFYRGALRAVNGTLWNVRKLPKQVGDRVTQDDLREGMIAAIKVSLDEPQFKGQTKAELGTPAVDGICSRAVADTLTDLFASMKRAQLKPLAAKIIESATSRVASRQAVLDRRKASATQSAALPAKLADCRKHGLGSELVIVEGDSAAGPAKRGRDSKTTAILPLRGKIVNAAKATRAQVLKNAEANALFTALGGGVGRRFELDSCRYERIIILCDADVDGSHIRCLLLTLLYTYLRPILLAGRVFVAQPPLYTVRVGAKVFRAFTDEERDGLERRLKRGKNARKELVWQRFKGLGEMNTSELRHCALDPRTRMLRRVSVIDAQAAKRMTSTLMGTNVAGRREFLSDYAGQLDLSKLDV